MKRLGALLVVLLFATACGSTAGALPSDRRMKVVASAYPVFEAVATIGGNRVHATNLLPLDPFAPLTEKQASQLHDASLAVVLGKGTQPEVERRTAQRSGPTVRVLDVFPHERLRHLEGQSVDPYVWENPQYMAVVAEQVRLALTSVDPAGAAKYRRNARNLDAMIAGVDRNYSRTIATCARRELVTADARFGYLADRYGLERVLVPGVGDDDLRAIVAARHPTTVFVSSLPSLDEARRIRTRSGVRLAVLDTTAAQTDQARRGGATYGNVMATNLDALRAALDCAAKPPGGK